MVYINADDKPCANLLNTAIKIYIVLFSKYDIKPYIMKLDPIKNTPENIRHRRPNLWINASILGLKNITAMGYAERI